MPSVLFVCTGNLHRSPMAEYFFKDKIKPDSNWQITSAGTYTREGLPTPPEVQTVLKDYGIDASAHRTKEVNRSLLEEHNLVLCLASNHKEALQFELLKARKSFQRDLDVTKLAIDKRLDSMLRKIKDLEKLAQAPLASPGSSGSFTEQEIKE